MAEPRKEDEAINLEAQSLDEFGRAPETGSDSPDPSPRLPGPQGSRRCQSSQRELLKNQFAVDN